MVCAVQDCFEGLHKGFETASLGSATRDPALCWKEPKLKAPPQVPVLAAPSRLCSLTALSPLALRGPDDRAPAPPAFSAL